MDRNPDTDIPIRQRRDETRRQPVVFRALTSTIDKLDTKAQQHSIPGLRLTRTDVIKACIVLAFRRPGELDKLLTEMRGEV